MAYYNIEKMKAKKRQQMERREKLRKLKEWIMKYSPELILLKTAAVLYLILLQPYVYQLVKDDLDGSQINTILSIICTLILFIKNKDMD